MNQVFKRLSLTAKLMLLAVVPLALLVYFSIQIYIEKSEKINVLNSYLDRIEQSTQISNLIDHLQSERRYSFGYVTSQQWKPELLMYRAKTDEALQQITSVPAFKNLPSYSLLDSLAMQRSRVDNLSVSPIEVKEYYTNVILRTNALNYVSTGTVSYLQPVKEDLASQKLLSEMVTYLGLIRADIYYALFTDRPAWEAAATVKNSFDLYKSYEKEFLLRSSASTLAAYNSIIQETALKPVMGYIVNLITNKTYDLQYNANEWAQVAATGVDELKHLQQRVTENVRSGIRQIFEREKAVRSRTLLFLTLSIILVISIVVYTINAITKALSELNQAAQLISRGESGVAVQVHTNDVIGNLARSIIRIDENSNRLALAAEAIGNGNFLVDVVSRSKKDVLGNAVAQMKHKLQLFTQENEDKLWIHQGRELVTESIRGQKELSQLAADALSALATYISGEVGLFYVQAEGFLEYQAGFAVSNLQEVPKRLKNGETLVGQAAAEKRLMHLKNLPESFLKISSGSGQSVPLNLLLIPLVHNNELEGIIELGAFQDFSAQSIELVNQVAPGIAIALHAAKSRTRLQELFEQTQSQAEELQAQHSELENINSELEAQTEKLQASEEELKVQQEELLQANQELEERSRLLEERNQLIVERNLQIQQKAEELAQSSKYKSEFLANMSHELRTPLNSVLLLSRLLAENESQNLTNDQVEYAQVIQSSGQGLLLLIDEILDLSKIEAGKMELEFRPVQLSEVVADMKALFAAVAAEKKLQLLIEADPELPAQIETDKMRLEQVLKNLLSNALKFTSQGSVQLHIATLKNNPAFIAFTVKDTGIGIAKEKQQLVFEAFQQADGSTRRRFGGTGLGLSISRELAKLLGGEIKLTSQPGAGSEFTVYLPVQQQGPAPVPVPEAADPPVPVQQIENELRSENIPQSIADDRDSLQPTDRSILIVEDDTAFAKTLVDFTRKKGYKALVAVRGDEGITLAQQYKPVGILLDLRLPVKNGWQVMEELKANTVTRHIPVHIMSSEEARKESLMKGAVDFINKPMAFEQMQQVFQKIEYVLSKEHKKVLIVEENARHAKALAYFLESFSVNTKIADSINNSVSDLKDEEVDCVILDMGIPTQQAYETLEEVKKNPGLENLPIIIFTGKSLSKAEELRIKQYADSIVIKTAHSYKRILDEVSLFLHLMEDKEEKQKPRYKRLGGLNEVLANKKILVTDDDVRNIFSLTKALELHNMQVLTAVDGKEALQRLQEHPDISAVLMDIMMPEMDGYEAMRKIRQQPQFKNLPVIAVTAKAMTGDREKCIQAGASDYISKPVDIDQLLSLLRVWLYNKTM